MDGIELTTLSEYKGLHNNLVFCKTINKEYDDRFAKVGAKNGGSLLIREPNQFTVRTGAVMDVQDITESTQTLTVATQKGVDVNFSSIDLTMSLDDLADRVLKPAMARLAAEIDSLVITGCAKAVANCIYTTIGTAPVISDVQAARARLSKGLAPSTDRYCLMESLSMNSVVNDSKGLFSPAPEISRQYNTGMVGHLAGFEFYESEMIPVITNGSRDDTTPVCNTSTGITSGTATITTTGADGTVVVGDVFTVADAYDVNPETKVRYEHLKQWVITAAHTNDGTDTWSVSPTPITSGAKQNCELVSAGAGKAVTFVGAGGSGAASTGYPTNLAYHKDFATFVTADLHMPKSAEMAAHDVYDGIAMRLWSAGDIVNDRFPCRFDVLFGYKVLRPEWCVRMPG